MQSNENRSGCQYRNKSGCQYRLVTEKAIVKIVMARMTSNFSVIVIMLNVV